MTITEKQLGQLRPADTNAASIYSPGADTTGIIKTIFVANTTGVARTFRIFLDDDGSTYDETTTLFYDVTVARNGTEIIDSFIPMNNSAGNLAVQSGTASALNFTVMGAEIT